MSSNNKAINRKHPDYRYGKPLYNACIAMRDALQYLGRPTKESEST